MLMMDNSTATLSCFEANQRHITKWTLGALIDFFCGKYYLTPFKTLAKDWLRTHNLALTFSQLLRFF